MSNTAAEIHPTAQRDWMTEAQRAAYAQLCTRWPRVSEPTKEIASTAAMVECFYPGSLGSMIIGIEEDGYTHS